MLADDITVDGVTYPTGPPIYALSQSAIANATTGQSGQAILVQLGADPEATAWASTMPVSPGDRVAWRRARAPPTPRARRPRT